MINISFIIPVYNVELYLERCVQSIISQNIECYEIILINDGSLDNSAAICNSLANSYDFIETIHQKNSGLSGARNTGLHKAKGEYIVFVDSDDKLKNGVIQSLINICIEEKLDVLCCDYCNEYANGIIQNSIVETIVTEGVVSGREYMKQVLYSNCLQMMVWMNIYRRQFIIDNRLEFPIGLNHEDEEWTPRVLECARRVKGVDSIFYQYLQRDDSISNDFTKFQENSLDQIKVCYRLKEYIRTWEDKELAQMYEDHIITLFLSAFQKGKLYKRAFNEYTNCHFFDGMEMGKKNQYKVKVYKLNRYLYFLISFFINKI